ncbi:hypothetical protein [Pseudarthrobacter sp. LT1]|uniref:hypothetical protein n=1 Tax=Pseudarthrobacter sp. LT1 TaxID=3111450 RepID=UPI002D79A197|nr:hypothetical protein [Pseudarthrobacter sp. LT1]WRT14597.1 hypothetical protein VIK36_03640 [Pseudarthrobacter sp. LT1]
MEQHDNAYPGASSHNRQANPSAEGRKQQGQPAPVWEGTADGAGRDGAAQGWNAQAGHPGPGQEPAGREQASRDQPQQEQPAQGWGAPVPGSPSAGWGTTTAQGQVPGSGMGWGAPQQYAPTDSTRGGKGNWTAKKGLLVGGVAVVVAAAAGAGAYAAGNGSGTASATNGQGAGAMGQVGPGSQSGVTGPDGQSGMGGGMAGGMDGGMSMDGGPGGLGVGPAGLNAAVHSEYVVLQGSGYVTMAGQAGTVTEISGTSMTVKSEDGFSRTYAVGSDVEVTQGMRQRGGGSTGTTLSFSNVTSGASVRVTALKDAETYTAETIQLAAATTASTPNQGSSSN